MVKWRIVSFWAQPIQNSKNCWHAEKAKRKKDQKTKKAQSCIHRSNKKRENVVDMVVFGYFITCNNWLSPATTYFAISLCCRLNHLIWLVPPWYRYLYCVLVLSLEIEISWFLQQAKKKTIGQAVGEIKQPNNRLLSLY